MNHQIAHEELVTLKADAYLKEEYRKKSDKAQTNLEKCIDTLNQIRGMAPNTEISALCWKVLGEVEV